MIHNDASEDPLNPEELEVVVEEETSQRRKFVKQYPTADLGWCFARFNSDTETLTIASPGDYSQSPAEPQAFVRICGKPHLHNLMHFIRGVLYPHSAK